MLKRIDHIGVLVEDLEAAKAFLTSMGLSMRLAIDTPNQGRIAAFFPCGNAEIEVIEDVDPKVKKEKLAGHRAKVEHIAIEVDDLRESLQALQGLGVTPNEHGVVSSRGRESAWTTPEATEGVMYQFVSYLDQSTLSS
jgi:methylmalonyl-CoA/ethylmalonyl-CoA epimerase